MQAGRLVASRDDLIADVLELRQPEIAAVLDNQFEAAGRAQAVDRRAPNDRHDRSADSRRQSLAVAAIASAVSRAVRFLNSLSMHEHRTEIGRVGVQDQRLARD